MCVAWLHSLLHATLLPGSGSGAANQRVERLATRGTQGGKLGQIQTVG
jgi:hypothetical protein